MALLRMDVDRAAYLRGLGTAMLFWGVVLAVFFFVSQVAGLIVGIGGFAASGVLEYLAFRNDPG